MMSARACHGLACKHLHPVAGAASSAAGQCRGYPASLLLLRVARPGRRPGDPSRWSVQLRVYAVVHLEPAAASPVQPLAYAVAAHLRQAGLNCWPRGATRSCRMARAAKGMKLDRQAPGELTLPGMALKGAAVGRVDRQPECPAGHESPPVRVGPRASAGPGRPRDLSAAGRPRY
jgi:hypothetical protein